MIEFASKLHNEESIVVLGMKADLAGVLLESGAEEANEMIVHVLEKLPML